MNEKVLMISDEALKSIANIWNSKDPLEGYLNLKNKVLNLETKTFLRYLTQFVQDREIQPDALENICKILTEQEVQKIEEIENSNEYYINRNPLKQEIARRYKLFSIGSAFSFGEIIDNVMPTIYYDNECFDVQIRQSIIYREGYRAYTLSRLFEALYGITRIPLRVQLSVLGYKIPEIRKWLQEIQRRNLSTTFIGLGGMNLNVIENLLELCKDLGITRLFENLTVYENDVLEYHNTLRFSTTALLQIKERTIDTREVLERFDPFYKCFIYHRRELDLLAKNSYITNKKFIPGDVYRRHIYFGAPDMETREAFFQANATFFCAIHQNNTVSLWHQPKVDLSMQTETYGRIMLTEFFLNILDVTIQFIKALAENKEYEKDVCIYKNTFNAYEQINNKGFIVPNYDTRSL